VIMLVNLEQNIREYQFNKQWIVATIAALALGGLLAFVYRTGRGVFPSAFYQTYRGLEGDNTQQIGIWLYGNYMLPIELILNAVNLNLVAFSRLYGLHGQVFAIFVITDAAAEAAVGLGIIIAFFRNKETVNVDEVDLLKW